MQILRTCLQEYAQRLESDLAKKTGEVEPMQARMRSIKALQAALRAARPQPTFAPWDRGREMDAKSADAFALLRLRARIAIGYMSNSNAADAARRAGQLHWR